MLCRKARELDSTPMAVGNTADHVHVLIRLSPGANVAELIKHLKGASAHRINLVRLPFRL